MGSRASAYLVYGFPLEAELDEGQFGEDGLFEFIYNARKKDLDYPVDVVCTSTYDYPNFILILPGTNNNTDWDGPLMINGMPELPQDKIDAMKAWITENGLDDHVADEEGWWLAAMFG